MYKIKKVIPLEDYRLQITFNTNEVFVFNVYPYLNKEVFKPLKDYNNFKHVFINPENSAITWENGIDFCSDALYKKYRSLSIT